MSALFRETARVAQLCDGETTRLFVLLASEAMQTQARHLELSTFALCALSGAGREETLIARRRKLEAIDAVRVEFRLGACNRITIPALEEGEVDGVPPNEPAPSKDHPPHSQGDICSDLDRKKDRRRKKSIVQGIKDAALISEPTEPVGPNDLPADLPPGTVRFSETEPFYTRPVNETPEVDPVLGTEGVHWVYQVYRSWAGRAWTSMKRVLSNGIRPRKPSELPPAAPEPEPIPVQQAKAPEYVRGQNVITAQGLAEAQTREMDATSRQTTEQQLFHAEVAAIRSRFRHIGDGVLEAIQSGMRYTVEQLALGSPILSGREDDLMAALSVQ